MMVLGGSLKRREMISARLGDVLSQLYLASAVLRNYEMDGRQQADLPFVHYALEQATQEAAKALDGVIRNFPNRAVGWLCRALLFPLGNHFNGPDDQRKREVAQAIMEPGCLRNRLTHLCPVDEQLSDGITELEQAFLARRQVAPLHKALKKAQRSGLLSRGPVSEALLAAAVEAKVLTEEQAEQVLTAHTLCRKAIDVDEFESL